MHRRTRETYVGATALSRQMKVLERIGRLLPFWPFRRQGDHTPDQTESRMYQI